MSALTIDNPVSFQNALVSRRIYPGDNIVLLDGTYQGDWTIPVTWEGTEAYPIKIRPQTPGGVLINGSLKIYGKHTHWYDIDFTDTNPDRVSTTEGITFGGIGTRLHGCLVRHMRNCGVVWFGNGAGEISECVIYNNKYYFTYTHNEGGLRTIARNVGARNLPTYTLHVYTEGANKLWDYTIEDNIFYGWQYIGGGEIKDLVLARNIQYGANGLTRIGWSVDNVNGLIDSNLFINLGEYTVRYANWQPGTLIELDNLAYNDNGYVWPTVDGYTQSGLPQVYSRVTPYSKSSRWVASVAVLNRDLANTVSVDMSSISAGNYRLRNGQNMDEEWEFEHIGGSIDIPMTGWTAEPALDGTVQAVTTPLFGSFVVERA